MMFVFLFLMLFSLNAFAAPLIVEEVDGRKATVYVPVGTEIKPGDELYAKIPEPPPKEEIIKTEIEAPTERPLRKREHLVIAKLSSSEAKLKMKDPINLTTSSKRTEFDLKYGRNFGWWMPVVAVGYSISKNSSLSDKASNIGFGAAINFIENKPGNDLIPFASLILGFHNEDIETSGVNVNAQGFMGQADIGLMWFPLGDTAAVMASASFAQTKLDISGGTSAAKGDLTGNGVSLGYIFAF